MKKSSFNQPRIRALEMLRDTLLPKLMSGVVRVTLHAATLAWRVRYEIY